jgi:ArsR family transcriptional regulator, arsenate/arsenite/antimonite-responsive transcriptional repressor
MSKYSVAGFRGFRRARFSVAVMAMISLHLDEPMDRAEIEKISKALADQTRLRIFEAISAAKQINCGEIVCMRGVTPATVSHHLKILSEAGLISCRREGQFVYSDVVPETIASYSRALTKIARCKKTPRRR